MVAIRLRLGVRLSVVACLALFQAIGCGTDVAEVPAVQRPPLSAGEAEMRRQHVTEPGPQGTEQLQVIARKLRPGVVLLGTRRLGDNGPYHFGGSGFVVSGKRRLISTAAHVADYFSAEAELVAVADGTVAAYPIKRVWYHPGLLRALDEGLFARSDDPLDGETAYGGPDVAVVQLSEEGPELSAQLELASGEELQNLQGQTVGLLGFSVTADDRWPTPSRPAGAKFSSFVVRLMVDAWHRADESVPMEQRQYLWYDSNLGPGGSGSPIFLPTGHVVGIATHGDAPESNDGTFRDLGFRVDCLRELLAFHGLDDSVVGSARVKVTRTDWGPDPQLGDFRRAVKLVRAADDLQRSGKLREAQLNCDEALALVPTYGNALIQRSKVLLDFLGTQSGGLSHEEKLAYAKSALSDSDRSVSLYPSWNEACLFNMEGKIYVARLTADTAEFRRTLKRADDMLRRDFPFHPLTDWGRSFAVNLRAQCHFFLGEMRQAGEDYNESITMAPNHASWYVNRARYWDKVGKPELAEADRRQAQALGFGRNAASPLSSSRPALPSLPKPTPDGPR